MLCPDFLGPNTCTLHYLKVVEVVGVEMEHAPIVQEVCQEGEAEVLKVAGDPWPHLPWRPVNLKMSLQKQFAFPQHYSHV